MRNLHLHMVVEEEMCRFTEIGFKKKYMQQNITKHISYLKISKSSMV